MQVARNKSNAITFLVVGTVPWHAGIHWLSRSYLCPGTGKCPMCKEQRAREVAYLPVKFRIDGETLLFEFPSETARRCEELAISAEYDTLEGLVFSFSRADQKSPWNVSLEKKTTAEYAPVPTWFVIDAVETLFGLPVRSNGRHCEPTPEEWHATYGDTLTRILNRAMAMELPR